MDIVAEGKKVFGVEIEALIRTKEALDDTFLKITDLIVHCEGKVIVTGMGKSGHIAQKIAATFASLGTPAFHMHPAEAMHGDLGMVTEDDVVIVISYSGESDEIIHILPNIKLIGATLVGITGNAGSTLAKNVDYIQILPVFEEACHLGLAPTSSTTAVLCYGDALAVVASAVYGFQKADFGRFHPAGALGKKLILRVGDLMSKEGCNAVIGLEASMKDAIIELGKKGLGAVSVVDDKGNMKGIITDGDLRRQLEKGVDVYHCKVSEIMTAEAVVITEDKLAVEALNQMKLKNVSCLPVVRENIAVGTIRIQDIVRAGIVG